MPQISLDWKIKQTMMLYFVCVVISSKMKLEVVTMQKNNLYKMILKIEIIIRK